MSRGCILCIVYVSEAARPHIIDKLMSSVSHCLIHTFKDVTYNRTSFYLLKPNTVEDAAVDLCVEATNHIDFEEHRGTHPSLGVVDHVYFSPIGNVSMTTISNVATQFSQKLLGKLEIPIYTYGAASSFNATLRDIRSDLGYFKQHCNNTVPTILDLTLNRSPDFGPTRSNPRIGVCCVGAIPLVVNFNMRFRISDDRKKVVKVTSSIREAGVIYIYLDDLFLNKFIYIFLLKDC
jgi:glutamate formiminotransferase